MLQALDDYVEERKDRPIKKNISKHLYNYRGFASWFKVIR